MTAYEVRISDWGSDVCSSDLIVATVALVALQRHVIRRTGSLAISADRLHYMGDILVNGAVILALLLAAEFGWLLADPIFGIGIAAFILYNAWQIAAGARPEERRVGKECGSTF